MYTILNFSNFILFLSKKHKHRRPLLLALSLFIAISSIPSGAASPTTFRHIGISQGLSQSSVLSITQDRLGNLWFGTQDGLNVYNGRDVKIYKTDFTNPTSLSNGLVRALYTDTYGQIWVGTASGLSRFDAQKESFDNFGDHSHGSVNHISAYGDGLALSTDHGLLLFHIAEQRFEQISLGTEAAVRSTYSTEGMLLIGSDAGLFLLQSGAVSPVPGFSEKDIPAIAPAQDGGWWIGTYGDGLYRTDSHFHVVRHFSGLSTLPSDYVRILHTDKNGRLWVGTYDGLAVYDDLEGTFKVCRHDSNSFSLSHDSVRAIYSDAQNGIWIGTWFGGVNYWNKQNEQIREITLSQKGIYGFVSCLCPDPSSCDIWVGTNDDGLFIYSSQDGSIHHPDIPLVSGNVKCIVPGSDDCLYIGMHMGGIMRLDPRRLQVRGFAINEHAPIKNGCYSLLEMTDGQWIVGSLEGLFLFDVRSGKISSHPAVTQVPELGKRLITVLFKDRSERLWIGTDEGFYRLSPDGSVRTQAELFPSVGAAGFHVNQIIQDSDERIWIASSKGLVEYSGITKPRLYTLEDGLPDNNVRSVLSGDGSLWFCSGRKICRLKPETRAVTVVNRPTENEFVDGAVCAASDGVIYFGGLGGLTRFDPDDMYSNPYSPLPFISGAEIDTRSSGELKRDESGACVSISVSSNKGPLVIHWSVVNPLSFGEDMFYYRLDGLDDKWHRTANYQETFTNLPPGNYTLLLRSENNDGVICDGNVSMAIRVLPRWWQSWLFRALLIIMSVAALAFIANLVVALLRAKIEIHTQKTEIRLLEENLDKTRSLLSGHSPNVSNGEVSADEEFLHRARQVVENNIDNEAFSSDEFARQMYMSRSKLYTRIQETTGGTVADFIRKIRFDKASSLLLEGRYTVSEISTMVGFSSPAYFATSFKKHTGCPPKEFGKSNAL